MNSLRACIAPSIVALLGCEPSPTSAPPAEPASPAIAIEIDAPDGGDASRASAAETAEAEAAPPDRAPAAIEAPVTFALETIRAGEGDAVAEGRVAVIAYRAALLSGETVAEATREEPWRVRIGEGDVIPGLERALRAMRAGGAARARIPAELAYGQRGLEREDGSWLVPPGAALVVEIELLELVPS